MLVQMVAKRSMWARSRPTTPPVLLWFGWTWCGTSLEFHAPRRAKIHIDAAIFSEGATARSFSAVIISSEDSCAARASWLKTDRTFVPRWSQMARCGGKSRSLLPPSIGADRSTSWPMKRSYNEWRDISESQVVATLSSIRSTSGSAPICETQDSN